MQSRLKAHIRQQADFPITPLGEIVIFPQMLPLDHLLLMPKEIKGSKWCEPADTAGAEYAAVNVSKHVCS